jgi:acetyl esterase/lipase
MRVVAAAVAALALAAIQPEYARQSDVIYGRTFGAALTMEALTPAARNGLGVVWVVSSSGISSREQTLTPGFERRVLPLLRRGYTVFAVIHGSAPLFQLQDHVRDVRRAVRFVRHRAAEFGVDPARLGITGSSAGGSLALLIAMQDDEGDPAAEDPVDRVPSRVQAAGGFFAPADFTAFGAAAAAAFAFHEVDPKTGARNPITDREHVLRLLRELSPVTHVSAGDPPTILIHGDADEAVPVQQSRELLARLHAANVPSRLVVREGKAHAWAGWEADSALVADWFDAHLRRSGRGR